MKKILLLALLALTTTSYANNPLNLSDKEYDYLNCLSGELFKKPANNKQANNAYINYPDFAKSKQMRSLFTMKMHSYNVGGDAPDTLILKPKRPISLLGLPISEISSQDDKGIGVTLTTPKSLKETQAILEKKYGQFTKYDSPISGEGFGISKIYTVNTEDGSYERYDHFISLEKAEKGKGTDISCIILNGG